MVREVLGSTIVFAPYSIDQALEGLAEAGYHACEIGAVKGWFEHIDPDTISDAEINRISTKLADLGLKPVSLSGHAQLQTAEGAARFLDKNADFQELAPAVATAGGHSIH